jgi:hypothetical protein
MFMAWKLPFFATTLAVSANSSRKDANEMLMAWKLPQMQIGAQQPAKHKENKSTAHESC